MAAGLLFSGCTLPGGNAGVICGAGFRTHFGTISFEPSVAKEHSHGDQALQKFMELGFDAQIL